MRKLLSVGALTAASLLPIGQPAIAQQSANADLQATVTPVRYMVVHRGRFWHRGRFYSHRHWRSGYWRRGRFVPGYWVYW